MGAKTSKRYSSLKSLLNPFKLFLNFFFSVVLSGPFLALLDSVSRVYSMGLLSIVCRPSVASIISVVIAWISFKF